MPAQAFDAAAYAAAAAARTASPGGHCCCIHYALIDPTAHKAVIAQLVSLAIAEVEKASVFLIGSSSKQDSKTCRFLELSGLFVVVFGILHTAVSLTTAKPQCVVFLHYIVRQQL